MYLTNNPAPVLENYVWTVEDHTNSETEQAELEERL